ncbi:MAG: hypothetical protein WD928_16250 [Gammaproteobacteria bacterium]
MTDDVARLGPADAVLATAVRGELRRYGLVLHYVAPAVAIPGSYWGGCEAGLRRNLLLVRTDTPVHSALHEACHSICMEPARRRVLDTDAGGDDLEECAVCYLSICLAADLPGFGRPRMLADMDTWGYSFRLGSARMWFERDATDAHDWLSRRAMIDPEGRPTGRCADAPTALTP